MGCNGHSVDVEGTISSVRNKVKDALKRYHVDGILLSGGIDSGILCSLSPHAKAITVTLEGTGEDLRYASILSEVIGIHPAVVNVTVDEALAALRQVIKIIESFDPALPNDLVVYFGMREAKRQGLSSIMTGDGADELFAGYPYMREMDDLNGYIRGTSRSLNFSSNRIGEYFGIAVKQPYLDADLIDFALMVPREFKIREEKGGVWGKWCLRKAFEPYLPPAFIWQGKRPLEKGSGMDLLRTIIAEKISDEAFEEKQRVYPVKFLCKEHLSFYEIYREEVGEIPLPQQGEEGCPGCGAGIPQGKRHCRVCGWVR